MWTVAAALGIAALLRASEVAFFALKIVGAVYLIWIGVQMLRARDRRRVTRGHGATTHRRGRRCARA